MYQRSIGRREFLMMSAAASGAAVLAACGAGSGGDEGSGSGAQKSGGAGSKGASEAFQGEAAVALLNVIVSAAPFVIANELFHDKHDLDIENTSYPGGTDTVRGLLSGGGFGSAATVSTLLAYQGGASNLRIIGGGFNAPSVVFLTMPDSPIEDYSDLGGKKISIGASGAPTEYFARLAAEKGGFKPDADVEIVPVGGTAEQLTAMQEGIVDVITTVAPISTGLIADGKAAQPFTGVDLVPAWADVCMVATTEMIDSDRSGLVRWLKAINDALDLIVEDVGEAAAVWAPVAEIDTEVAKQTLSDVPAEAWTLDIPDAAVQANADAVLALGTGTEMDVSEVVDRSLLEEL